MSTLTPTDYFGQICIKSLPVFVILAPALCAAAPGELDATFGMNGYVATPFSTDEGDWASGVAVQSDGKIVVVGFVIVSNGSAFALARYTAGGNLDATFGTAGLVTTDLRPGLQDKGKAVALQADGKIVAVGFAGVGVGTDTDFALVRYNADGSLDSSFGSGGIVTTNFPGTSEEATNLAIQPDGKIIAVGYTRASSTDFALARYNGDGSLDTTFGSGGLVTSAFAEDTIGLSAVVLQPDGKIIACGGVFNGDNIMDFALVRYHGDGGLDTTFGTGGLVTAHISNKEAFSDVALLPDGRIIAAGTSQIDGVTGFDFVLARYHDDGALDTSFGSGGFVITDFAGRTDWVNSVVIQDDGKIVAAGKVHVADADFGLARYNSDGTLDTTFSEDGLVTTDFSNGTNEVYALALQNDGKIIAVGRGGGTDGTEADFLVARYDAYGESVAGPEIPTVSTWGLVALLLLTLIAGTLVLTRRLAPKGAANRHDFRVD